MSSTDYKALKENLMEKFGHEIGDREGVPSGNEPKDMGNRGFGSDLKEEEKLTCEYCGGMMKYEGDSCSECGMMPMMSTVEEQEVSQVAPPGMEKVVKALKKQGKVENPWAVAWSMYNKKKGKK